VVWARIGQSQHETLPSPGSPYSPRELSIHGLSEDTTEVEAQAIAGDIRPKIAWQTGEAVKGAAALGRAGPPAKIAHTDLDLWARVHSARCVKAR
jgi:hypothetical protein